MGYPVRGGTYNLDACIAQASFIQEEISQAVAADVDVKCEFTTDNYVSKVYIDGVDKTSSVSGNLNSWPSRKTITFKSSASKLAFQVNDAEQGCYNGGFAITCKSDNKDWTISSNSKKKWKVYSVRAGGSKTSVSSSQFPPDVAGKKWYEPGYKAGDKFFEPRFGRTSYADGVIKTDGKNTQDFCGGGPNERDNHWFFIYEGTPSGITYGQQLTYTCTKGFSTLGTCDKSSKQSFTATCTEKGSLKFDDDKAKQCIGNLAGTPSVERDGLQNAFFVSRAYRFPEKVKVTCKPGYVVQDKGADAALGEATGAEVTCQFTADNYISKVYLDGVDKTGSVSGNLNSWPTVKTIKFKSGVGKIAIQANDAEQGCRNGGFAITCSDPDGRWDISSNSKTGWKVFSVRASGSPSSIRSDQFPPDVDGKKWYEVDYKPGSKFYEPRFGSTSYADSRIKTNGKNTQDFCGGSSNDRENHWFFVYTMSGITEPVLKPKVRYLSATTSCEFTGKPEFEMPMAQGLLLDFRGGVGISTTKWKNQAKLKGGKDADVPSAVKYDKKEKAWLMPGRGPVITVPIATNPRQMNAVTYSGWVKPLDFRGTLGWVLTQYPDFGWSRSITMSDGRLGGTGVTPGGYNSGIGNLPLNKWTHVAGVWTRNGGPCYIYANMKKHNRNCNNGQGSNGNEKFIIGGRGPNDGGHNPKVMVTDVAVWNIALSEDDIMKLYNEGKRPSQAASFIQGARVQDLAWMKQSSREAAVTEAGGVDVTCDFTADNYVYKVYIDGVDKTGTVSGNMDSWPSRKTIKFKNGVSKLAFQANDAEQGCRNGGFAITCRSADPAWTMSSNSNVGWKVYAQKAGGGKTALPTNKYPPAVAGKQWYEVGYNPGPEFFVPRNGSTTYADSVIKTNGKNTQDFCSGSADMTANHWFFIYQEARIGVGCAPITCVNAPKLANANMTGGSAVFGEKGLTYKCDEGHTTTGVVGDNAIQSLQCHSDGTFDKAKDCKPISCGKPTKVADAEISANQEMFYEKREETGVIGFINMEADQESYMATSGGKVERLTSKIGESKKCPAGDHSCIFVGYGTNHNGKRVTEWANTASKGKKFVVRNERSDPQYFTVYATQPAKVKVTRGTSKTKVTEFSLTKGQIKQFSGSYNGQIVTIESSGNIVVSKESNGADYTNLVPAAQTIYGTCATSCWIVVFGGSRQPIEEECSDGSTRKLSSNYQHRITGSCSYTQKACKWTAPSGVLISGHSWADCDGGDGTTFLPAHLFQLVTPIPLNMQYVKLIGIKKTTCSYKKGKFQLSGNKGVFTTRLGAVTKGDVIVCDHPVQALGDDTLYNDEFQIITAADTGGEEPMGAASGAEVTCEFTTDNYVSKVYLDGVDETGSVSGNLNSWPTVKTVKFKSDVTKMAFQVNDAEQGCFNGGFAITCRSSDPNWVVSSNSKQGWKVYSKRAGGSKTSLPKNQYPPAVDGLDWYEIGYKAPSTFSEPRFGRTSYADSRIKTDGKNTQDFCGGSPNERDNHWFFIFEMGVRDHLGQEVPWTTLYSTGSFGKEQASKDEFNKLFQKARSGIAKRECADCGAEHKEIYFRRKTSPATYDAWEGLMVTWRGDVGFHKDFDLYGSMADALADTNAWKACNGNDKNIGFPRDCGATKNVGGQWNSLTRGGQKNYKWSVQAQVFYTCNTGYTLNRKPAVRGAVGTVFPIWCKADGNIGGLKDCKKIECEMPEMAGANAKYDPPKSPRYFGDTLAMTCNPGFSIDGLETGATTFSETCGATGLFESGGKSCMDIAYCKSNDCGKGDCEELPLGYKCNCHTGYKQVVKAGKPVCEEIDECISGPWFGDLKCTKHGKCIDKLNTYKCECNTGYEITTASCGGSTCEACRIKSCGIPKPDLIGFATTEETKKMVYGNTVKYSCKPGYSVDGKASSSKEITVTCKADGVFSDDHPKECKSTSCPAPTEENVERLEAPPTPVVVMPVTKGLNLDFRGGVGVSKNKWENQVDGPDADVPSAVQYIETEKAWLFPGRGAVITVPLATNPSKMTAVTYSGWVKPLDYRGTLGWVMTQYPDFGWSRSVTISDGRLGGTGVTPGGYNSGLGNLPIGHWSHLAGVWSSRGGPCSIYHNNKKFSRNCGNGQGSNGNEQFIIGGRGPNDGGHNAKVMMTDVAVFNRALTDKEVELLYNKGKRPSASFLQTNDTSKLQVSQASATKTHKAKTASFVNMEADQESYMATSSGKVTSTKKPVGTLVKCPSDDPDCIIVGYGSNHNGKRVTEWANTALKGKQFTVYNFRSAPQYYTMYAMQNAEVLVSYGSSNKQRYRLSMKKGEHKTMSSNEMGGSMLNDVTHFTADGDILVSTESNGADYTNLAPAAQVIYGTCSTAGYVAVYGGKTATITQECSDGYSRTFTAHVYKESCSGQFTGRSCKWTAPEGVLIAGHTWADGDGGDGVTYLPSKYFQKETPMPVDMEFVKLVSDKKASCSYNDGKNKITLTGSDATSVYDYRISNPPKSVIKCDMAVQAFGDERSHHDELNLIALSDTDGEEDTPGYVRYYQCSTGYTKSGAPDDDVSLSTTCGMDGKYSLDPVACKPALCGQVPMMSNVKEVTTESGVDSKSMTYGDLARVTCAKGSTITGKVGGDDHYEVLCQANGTFAIEASCKKIKCTVPKLKDGKYEGTSVREFGEKAKGVCNPGFEPSDSKDSFDITCGADGKFSGMETCKRVSCGVAQPTKYATVKSTYSQASMPVTAGLNLDFRGGLGVSSTIWKNQVNGPDAEVPSGVTYDSNEKAWLFPGRGAVMTVPLATNPAKMTAVSYSGWVKPLDYRSTLGWVMTQYPDFGWSRAVTISDGRLGGTGVTPGGYNSGLGNLPIGQWSHLVGVWSSRGGPCAIYRNKQKYSRSCGNGQGSNGNEKFIIGGRGPNDGGHNPKVMMTDVAVFNRVLTDTEVELLYNNGKRPSAFLQMNATSLLQEDQATDAPADAAVPVGGGATYTCKPGYSVTGTPGGETEFDLECTAAGFATGDCQDIDFCEDNPCGANGQCTDCSTSACKQSAASSMFLQGAKGDYKSNGDYACQCAKGYEVKKGASKLTCSEDDCGGPNGDKCGAGGSCMDLSSSPNAKEGAYSCLCSSGYKLMDNGPAPRCEPITCDPVTVTSATSLHKTKDGKITSGTIGFMDQVVYSCVTGYVTSKGAEKFTTHCAASGKLKTMDACQPVKCPLKGLRALLGPGMEYARKLRVSPYIYQDTAGFDCKTGYELQAVLNLPMAQELKLDLRGGVGIKVVAKDGTKIWSNQVKDGPNAYVDQSIQYDTAEKAWIMPGKGNVIEVHKFATNPLKMPATTYSAWVKPLDYRGTLGWVMTQYPDYGWSRSVTISDGRLGGTGVTPGGYNSGMGNLPLNKWSHLAGVWTSRGGKCWIYVNTKKYSRSCSNGQGSNSNENFMIGGRGLHDQGHNAKIMITDVAVWSAALSEADIITLYNKGTRPSQVSFLQTSQTKVNESIDIWGAAGATPDIDGGGWIHVRHVPSRAQWHPATDQLKGTDVYGSPSNSKSPWSVKFPSEFDEYLFATGDLSKWLIADKSSVTGGWYSNALRDIKKSSKSATAYKARWYRRSGNKEDPWVSIIDHGPAIGGDQIVYGENNFGSTHARILTQSGGADVYVRKAPDLLATCGADGAFTKEDGSCEPVSCGNVPTVPKTVSVSGTELKYKEKFTYQCVQGYAVDDAAGVTTFDVQCGADKMLTGFKQCTPMCCGGLYNPCYGPGGEKKVVCKAGETITGKPGGARSFTVSCRIDKGGAKSVVGSATCKKVTFKIKGVIQNAADSSDKAEGVSVEFRGQAISSFQLPASGSLKLDFRAGVGVSSSKWKNQVTGPDATVSSAVKYDSNEKAWLFPGRGQVITVPIATNPAKMTAVTYSGWVKPLDYQSTLGWVLTQYPDFGWSRSITMSDGRLGGTGVTPGGYNSGLGNLPLNKWSHVAGVWTSRGGKCWIYANMKKYSRSCSNGQGSNNNEKFIIGGRGPNDGGHNAKVMVADVALWNKALSEEEVKTLYNEGKRPTSSATPDTAQGGNEWKLGDKGKSCDEVCAASSLKCYETAQAIHNTEVYTEQTFQATMNGIGNNKDCPRFAPSQLQEAYSPGVYANGSCLVSVVGRTYDTFSCAGKLSGFQRLCYCQPELSDPITTKTDSNGAYELTLGEGLYDVKVSGGKADLPMSQELKLDLRGGVDIKVVAKDGTKTWGNQVKDGPNAYVDQSIQYDSREKAWIMPGKGNVIEVHKFATNPLKMPATTYSAWVKPLDYQGTLGWVMTQYPDYGWSRSVTISDGRLGGTGVTPGGYNSGMGNLPLNKWSHLAGVWTSRGGKCWIYVNTKKYSRSCSNGQGSNSNENFMIGGRGLHDRGHNAKVMITDVAVWSAALSEADIITLYNKGTRPSQAGPGIATSVYKLVVDKSESVNMKVMPALKSNDMRITLTWGESPKDLDAVLVYGDQVSCDKAKGECSGTCEASVDSRDLCQSRTSPVQAHLALDETQGWGPESMIVSKIDKCSPSKDTNCAAVFMVKNDDGTLSGTVKVQTFTGSGSTTEGKVVLPSDKKTWPLFTIDTSTGEVFKGYYDPLSQCAKNDWNMWLYKETEWEGKPDKRDCKPSYEEAGDLFKGDSYNVRYISKAEFTQGKYRFEVKSPTFTLFVDGSQVLNGNSPSGFMQSAQITLTDGVHFIDLKAKGSTKALEIKWIDSAGKEYVRGGAPTCQIIANDNTDANKLYCGGDGFISESMDVTLDDCQEKCQKTSGCTIYTSVERVGHWSGRCMLYRGSCSNKIPMGYPVRGGTYNLDACIAQGNSEYITMPAIGNLKLDLRGGIDVSSTKWGNQVSGPDASVSSAVKYDAVEKAWLFPGRGQVITVPLTTNPSKMRSVTYSGWVKPLDYQGTLGWVMTQYPDFGWSRSVTISDGRLGGTGVTPGGYNSGLGNLPLNKWSHVAGVWTSRGGTCWIYANMRKYQRSCSNGQGGNNNEKFIIGGRGPNDGGHNAKVMMTDVAVWDKVLNEAEIRVLYNNGVRPSQASSTFTLPASGSLKLDFRAGVGVSSTKWENQVSGPDATVSSAVKYDSSEKAWLFPGKGQVITVPIATNPSKMTAVTYSGWVKPLDYRGTLGWVLTQYPDFGWSRSVTMSDGRLGGTGVTPGGYNSGLGNLPLNQWSHVAGVWTSRGGTCWIYANMRKYQRSCSNGQGSNGNEKFIIGGRGPNDGGHNAKVMVADVALWDKALSESEVRTLYNNGKRPSSSSSPEPVQAIDGGGWIHVRHVNARAQWHPATDQLLGTDVYGSPSNSNSPWSVKFPSTYNEFLFATGDLKKWLIASKSEVTGGFYSNALRTIKKSSKSSSSYRARWYRRRGNREDPWVSIIDHGPAISGDQIVYGENNFGSTHARILTQSKGADVYVRQAR